MGAGGSCLGSVEAKFDFLHVLKEKIKKGMAERNLQCRPDGTSLLGNYEINSVM